MKVKRILELPEKIIHVRHKKKNLYGSIIFFIEVLVKKIRNNSGQ